MSNEYKDWTIENYKEEIILLKQQRDHFERENANQGNLLNKVIRQRDEYKKALQWYADRYSNENGKPTVAQKAIAKEKEQK